MKGTILKFNNDDKKGLILGENGNRYSFDYDSDWLTKTTEVIINSEVDFVINEEKATEIYCLGNKSNIYGIKKIDFNEIQKQLEDKNKLNEVKKELIQTVYIHLFLSLFLIGLGILSETLKWGSMTTGVFYWMFLFSLIPFAKSLFHIFFPEVHLKYKIISSYYKDNLTIINYVPENTNYVLLELINASSNSLEDAKNKLISKAYKLKADAIINYTNDVSKASIVEGRRNISTKVRTYYEVQGMAIKLI